MHEASLSFSVGGYRIGRRLSHGRFLGHALAPSLVELVFLNELSSEEQRLVCSEAQDFSSLPDGGRVAILPRPANTEETPNPEKYPNIRLTTPPDLIESWRHMEEATATASATTPPSERDGTALLGRVRGLLKRARRGPLVLAALAGTLAVLAVVTLLPGAPSGTDSSADSRSVSIADSGTTSSSVLGQMSPREATPISTPMSTSTSSLSGLPTAIEPLDPASSLGDFILVRVPAKSGQEPGEIAVLERTADSWIVRDIYPAT